MKKILIAALTAAFAIGTATPVLAGEVEIRVSLQGLDLTSAADIAEVEERIDVAVNEACSEASSLYARAQCRRSGKRQALAQLESRTQLAMVETGTSVH